MDISLPIKKPGIYFLKAEASGVNTETFIVVSQNGTIIREDRDDYLFWTQNFQNGQSQPNVNLAFYNLEKKVTLLRRAQTDSQGLLKLAKLNDCDLIVATKGDDVQIIPVDIPFSGKIDRSKFWWGAPKKYKVFVYTDRPIYKPGDTGYFRGIVRLDNDALYRLPAAGTPVKVEISQYDTDPVYSGALTLNSQGVFFGEFKLPEEIRTGGYSLKLTIGEEEHPYAAHFDIAAYRKPEYFLSLETDHFEYINGDTITATVTGQYFFGQPLAGKEVEYQVKVADFYERENADYSYYQDEVLYHSYYGKEITRGKVKLDENGRATFKIETKIGEEESSKIYLLFVYFRDETQNPSVAGKNVLVHQGEFNLFGQKLKYSVPLGEKIQLRVKALGVDQKARSGVLVSAETKRQWWAAKGTDQKHPFYEKKEENLDKLSGVTDEEGIVSFSFTPQRSGSFQVKVSAQDSRGNKISRRFYFWVYDPRERNIFSRDHAEADQITLTLDKESYRVGETARITASLPGRTAQLLLTAERNKIYEYRILTTESELISFEFKITENHVPNIFINLSAFIDNEFKDESINLPVAADHKKITIKIVPNREQYRPGEEVQLTLKTTDSSGTPVSANLSLAVVDKAIYELGADQTPEIFRHFYNERSQTVSFTHSKANIGESLGGAGGGGGGDYREVFADTAYWNPNIQTNADGLATVSFRLPDNLTTWVIAAYGATIDTKVGQAKDEILVTKEVVVRPFLPNFFTGGDQVTLQTSVQNYQGKDDNFSVKLETEGLILESAESQNIWLENGGSGTVFWNVRVGDNTERATLIFSAKAESTEKGDVVKVELPVKPYGFKEFNVQSGIDNGEVKIKLDPESQNSRSKVTINLAPSLASSIPEALTRLAGYPYGCIEQTTSRFVPVVIVKKNLSYLGITKPRIVDHLDEMLKAGFDRLLALQGDNGGWSWWRGDYADVFITSYVLESLQQVREAGVEVPEKLFNKALEFLKKKQDYFQEGKEAIYSNYTLSLIDPSLALEGNYEADDLDDDELAVYILLLKNIGKEEKAKQLASALLDRVQHSPGGYLSWQAGKKETFGSVEKSTALAVRALLATGTKPEDLSGAVRFLVRGNLGNFRHSTYATAQTILAIIDYTKATSEFSPDYTYQIRLDGEIIKEGRITSGNFRQTIAPIELDINQINPAGSTIEIVKNGQGKLYYSVVLTEFSTRKDNVAEDNGLVISRTYRGLDGKTSGFKVGDIVKVELEVQNKQGVESPYVIIEDRLPSGFVPIDTNLNNQKQYRSENQDHWFVVQDIRFDGANLYPYWLRPGINKFVYLARVISTGVFQVPPAVGYLMYEPEISGRSNSAVITVTK